jgi:hypothetical protein
MAISGKLRERPLVTVESTYLPVASNGIACAYVELDALAGFERTLLTSMITLVTQSRGRAFDHQGSDPYNQRGASGPAAVNVGERQAMQEISLIPRRSVPPGQPRSNPARIHFSRRKSILGLPF